MPRLLVDAALFSKQPMEARLISKCGHKVLVVERDDE